VALVWRKLCEFDYAVSDCCPVKLRNLALQFFLSSFRSVDLIAEPDSSRSGIRALRSQDSIPAAVAVPRFLLRLK